MEFILQNLMFCIGYKKGEHELYNKCITGVADRNILFFSVESSFLLLEALNVRAGNFLFHNSGPLHLLLDSTILFKMSFRWHLQRSCLLKMIVMDIH